MHLRGQSSEGFICPDDVDVEGPGPGPGAQLGLLPASLPASLPACAQLGLLPAYLPVCLPAPANASSSHFFSPEAPHRDPQPWKMSARLHF